MKPDVLAGLTARQRFKRELADLDFLSQQPATRTSTPEQTAHYQSLGYDISHVRGYDSDEPEVGVCLRVDLHHTYIPGNLVGPCVDCGCDIQYRPTLPAEIEKLCICCAARRLREEQEC